jgi:hypothetical protein
MRLTLRYPYFVARSCTAASPFVMRSIETPIGGQLAENVT